MQTYFIMDLKCFRLVKKLMLTKFSCTVIKGTLVPVHHATKAAVHREMALICFQTLVLIVDVCISSSLQP
jgi:hypothetical protein